MHTIVARAGCAWWLLCFPLVAEAGPFQLVRTINDPHPVFYGHFSFAMANYNSDVLVGAIGAQRVYLINPETGATLGTYRSPDASGNISFGRTLTQLDNGRFAVGDYEGDMSPYVRTGSVYTFDANTGQALLTIRNPNPGTFTYFGASLEFAPGHLFASANSPSSNDRGKVHVFDPVSGQLQNTLQSPDNTAGSWGFGFEMERYRGDVFVSAPGAYSGGHQTGSVYLYDGSTLQRKMTLAPPDPLNTAGFGWSIDTSGSLLLVGAPTTSVGGVNNVGAAYLYDGTTGALLRTFRNPSPAQWDDFGNAVALVGDFAVINKTTFAGEALVFSTATGQYLGSIANPGDGVYFAQNGGAQSGGLLSAGSRLLVAGWANSAGQTDSGAMYVYAVPEPGTAVYAACALAIIGILYMRGARRRPVRAIQAGGLRKE